MNDHDDDMWQFGNLTETMVADGEDSETETHGECLEEQGREEGLGEVGMAEAEDSLFLPPENSLTTNWTVTWLAPKCLGQRT